MRFGICILAGEAGEAIRAGFDYVEIAARTLVDEAAPKPPSEIPVFATNLFFDDRARLFGPRRTEYIPYAKRVILLAAQFGVRTMVVGSGGARRAEGGDGDDRAFVEIVAELARIARLRGIVIAPEALNAGETNVGNDSGRLALLLRDADVGWTLDTYHALVEWDRFGRHESLEAMWERAIPYAPSHVHMASLAREAPRPDDPMVVRAIRRLKELGYDGTASLECLRGEAFDFAAAVRDLRELFG